MSIGPLTDPVTRAAAAALNGVQLRQQVVAQNLANASTPGYREKQVSFEDQLAAAMASGQPPESVTPAVSYADTPVQADGNSVDVTQQAMMLDQTSLQYQSLVSVVNFRNNIIKDALTQ